ncbi:MAG: hemerythrin domain-containing protein [Bacillota bacterium]
MLAEKLTDAVRQEHREIRDTLIDLIEAFHQRDMKLVQSLLARFDMLMGPHFRYEEESVYHMMVPILGTDYIQQLLTEHDRMIGIAKRLMDFSEKDLLTDDELACAIKMIRRLLLHVSQCEGLSVMAERLSEEEVQRILDSRERAKKANVSLIEWSDAMRSRPVTMPEPGLLAVESLELRCTD